MIYEIDTLFDCIMIATIYNENLDVISSKELQYSYSTLYRGESLNKLIQNEITDYDINHSLLFFCFYLIPNFKKS